MKNLFLILLFLCILVPGTLYGDDSDIKVLAKFPRKAGMDSEPFGYGPAWGKFIASGSDTDYVFAFAGRKPDGIPSGEPTEYYLYLFTWNDEDTDTLTSVAYVGSLNTHYDSLTCMGHDTYTNNNIWCPTMFWDLDADGNDELITRTKDPTTTSDTTWLSIITTPQDSSSWATADSIEFQDWTYANQNHMAYLTVAYLDGYDTVPSIIVTRGLHKEADIMAYDVELPLDNTSLTKRWVDPYTTTDTTSGCGGQNVYGADVDLDGDQEILFGTICIEKDKSTKWFIKTAADTAVGHADWMTLGDIDRDSAGLEIAFGVEKGGTHSNGRGGVYVADAATGIVYWALTDTGMYYGSTDMDLGFATDLIPSIPGLEIYCIQDNPAAYEDSVRHWWIFDCKGNQLSQDGASFTAWHKIWWPFRWQSNGLMTSLGSTSYRRKLADQVSYWDWENVEYFKNVKTLNRRSLKFNIYGDGRWELIEASPQKTNYDYLRLLTSQETGEGFLTHTTWDNITFDISTRDGLTGYTFDPFWLYTITYSKAELVWGFGRIDRPAGYIASGFRIRNPGGLPWDMGRYAVQEVTQPAPEPPEAGIWIFADK